MSDLCSDVLEELDQAGAVLLDKHFVYKSGKHGSGYVNMDPLFPDIGLMRRLCRELARPFGGEWDTVAAPAVGGVALSVLTAVAAADDGVASTAVWADKSGDGFVFERAGFVEHLAGKRVLVVEDLLTTGGSVMKVCREAEEHGAELVGVSVICNRGGVTAETLGVPRLESLAQVDFRTMDPDECTLCTAHVPIVEDIGHGARFRATNPAYAGGYFQLLGQYARP